MDCGRMLDLAYHGDDKPKQDITNIEQDHHKNSKLKKHD
jgi:hypothetical protein